MHIRRSLSCLIVAVALSVAASSAFADGFKFESRLSGAQEVVLDTEGNLIPGGVATEASGSIRADFDAALSRVFVSLRVRDLTGGFLASHFHCGRPGQNGPVAFGLVSPGPLSFDGERIRGELTNTDFTGANCVPVVGRPVNNIAALAQAMADGLVYINVHTSFAPGGEIRGQMTGRSGEGDRGRRGDGREDGDD